jgi:hypothetical protein
MAITTSIQPHRKPLRCSARTHGVVEDGEIRLRCTERSCPDVIAAKARGERAIHVYDAWSGELLRTEFEAGPVALKKAG